MTEAREVVERFQAIILGVGDVVEAVEDEAGAEELYAALLEVAEPDFETAMVSVDYDPSGIEARGPEGFRDAWTEWMSPFESYRIEVDEVIEAGDRVVSLVHQTGRTRTGGVEITAQAAAVWTVRNGKVARVEFHLDQQRAMREAGAEPQSSQE